MQGRNAIGDEKDTVDTCPRKGTTKSSDTALALPLGTVFNIIGGLLTLWRRSPEEEHRSFEVQKAKRWHALQKPMIQEHKEDNQR